MTGLPDLIRPRARRASDRPPGLLDLLGDRFAGTPIGGLLGWGTGPRQEDPRLGVGDILADRFAQAPIGGLLGLQAPARAMRPPARPVGLGAASAAQGGSTSTSPMAPFLPLLDRTEGGGAYDTLFGFSNREGPFAGVDITTMPVGEVLRFADTAGPYAQYVAANNDGTVATPLGRYQVVGATLADAVKALRIDPSQPFDAATQDRVAAWLAQRRLSGTDDPAAQMAALRDEWHGFRNVPDAELAAAIQAFQSAGPLPPGAPPLRPPALAATASGPRMMQSTSRTTGAPPLQSQFDASNMSPAALQALARLEQVAGRGFTVNSAYRDPEHNARVGGAKHSQHTHGNAVDIDVSGLSTGERNELIRLARASGFQGVGVYDNALHFDVGPERHWGPDYSRRSTPSWALPALAATPGHATHPDIAGAFGASFSSSGGNPVGLLSDPRVSTQGGGLLGYQPTTPDPLSPFPQAERRPSIWDRLEGVQGLGWLADPERRLRLAAALEGMTLSPNQALLDSYQAEISELRGEEKAMRAAQWFMENDQPDLAAAVMGGVDPEQLMGVLMERRQPQPPIIEGGRVYHPLTGELLADHNTPDSPDLPASVREWQFYAAEEEAAGRSPMPYGEWAQDGGGAEPSFMTGAEVAEFFGVTVEDPHALFVVGEDGPKLVGGTGAPDATGAGGVDRSLNVLWGTDADGNRVPLQVGDDGTAVATQMPEGITATAGFDRVDLGTAWGVVDKATGQMVGTIPKDNYGAAFDAAQGSAAGQNIGDRAAAAPATIAQAQQMLDLIGQIKSDPALPSITGSWQGNLPAGIPLITGGQAGGDLAVKIQQLQGQTFLTAIDQLRGMGALSNVEGTTAKEAVARLARAQSPEEYRWALTELEATVRGGLERAEAMLSQGTGAAPAAATAPAPNGAPAVIEYDAQGNRIGG